MKKLFLLLFFLPLISFAQEITPAVAKVVVAPKHEFGFHLASASIIGGIEDLSGNLTLFIDYNFFDGVYYKRHFGKWALRGSFNYHQKIEQSVYNPQPNIYEYSIDRTREMIYRAGAERSFEKGKVQFYAFADLNFMYREFKREQVGTGNILPFKRSIRSTVYGPGLMAGLGIRYNPTKNITLFYEANLMVNYMTYGRRENYNRWSTYEGRINVGTIGLGIRI